jgi:manganese-transporting P-type ATPase
VALNSAMNSNASLSATSSTPSLCCAVHAGKGIVIKVKHRYPFSSALKRMSVIAECSIPFKAESGLFIFSKGAPEVLASYMDVIPPFYQDTYVHHMTRGKRVLALAYRKVQSTSQQTLQDLRDTPRSQIESGLTFAGFLVFDCDLKVDSKSVIRELISSDHKVIMITGDSAYTAADVAAKLGMTRTGAGAGLLNLESKTLSSANGNGNGAGAGFEELVWRKVAGAAASGSGSGKNKVSPPPSVSTDIPFQPSLEALRSLSAQYSLCVTGSTLLALQTSNADSGSAVLKALCPNVTVFARVSPAQKVCKYVQEIRRSVFLCKDWIIL